MSDQPIGDGAHQRLLLTHARIGLLVRAGNRLLASILLMGSIFCCVSFYGFQLFKQPEQALQLQSYMFNYSELAQVDKNLSVEGSPARQKIKPVDPNWDGALAGASVGLAIGRDIPLIGTVVGPVAGAMLGYNLDSRI